MLYLDSSALVKLTLPEDESSVLAAYVAGRDVISCELVLAEVPRAIVNSTTGLDDAQQEMLLADALDLLGELPMVPVNGDLLAAAGLVRADRLRALDAIHLTAALSHAADLKAFVTYDARQAAAAAAHDLPVETPA